MADFLMPGDAGYVADGVHLDLPAEDYFLQGLGSTDLMSLWFQKEGFWWRSRWNPRCKREETKEQLYGSASHAIILEGIWAYEFRFVAAPDWSQIPDLFDGLDRIKAELIKAGFNLKGLKRADNSPWVKDDYVQAIIDNDVDIPCKSALELRFRESIGTRTVLPNEDDELLRLLREVMLDPDRDDNEEIRHIFGDYSGFPTLAEVSVIHTLPNGVRRRWRIDRMFPKFDLDLKTLGDWRGRPLRFATGDIIASRGYDIQRADYKRGRQIAYAYIRAGKIYGGAQDQREWLQTWPDQFPTWDWKWLFYQKPDSKAGRAPVLFPIHDDDGSLRERTGAVKADVAYNRFCHYRAKYGMDKPWARVEPQHWTDESYDPQRSIIFPHWIDDVEDVSGEAAAWADQGAAR